MLEAYTVGRYAVDVGRGRPRIAIAAQVIRPETIEVKQDYAKKMPLIMGDKNQLEQVLMNIILNSVEVLPPGGEICITSNPKDQLLNLQIMDNGPGIHEEYLESIFDPFFTTKEEGKGTGLGWSISYGGRLLTGGCN